MQVPTDRGESPPGPPSNGHGPPWRRISGSQAIGVVRVAETIATFDISLWNFRTATPLDGPAPDLSY